MPNTSTLNTVRTGMNQDTHFSIMEKGQYSFALNSAIENFRGDYLTLQNNDSNYLAINFTEGYKVIGRKYIIEFDRTLYFLVNPETAMSQIGYVVNNTFVETTDLSGSAICNDCATVVNTEKAPLEKQTQIPYCSFTSIVISDCLDLDINSPIDIEYRIFEGAIYIYFVDNKNPLRFIYLNSDFTLQDIFKVITGYDPDNCDLPIYSDELDCNKIRYNPDFSKPEIVEIEDIPGGQNKAGVYQILIAYADVLGNPLTSYFDESFPYPLKTKDITIETDYVTDRAISIKIDNIDTTNVFGYYNIVVARTVNNFTTFYLVATLPVTVDHYVITGSDSQTIKNLSESDVFFKYPIYERAASITSANGYLFFARLKEYKKLNLQQAVNRVRVFWQTIGIKEEVLRKANNVSKYRGYMRDEVYPLGLVFELEDDNDTLVFPLIGPSKEYLEEKYEIDLDEIIDNPDVIEQANCEGIVRNKRYQVYNTAQLITAPHELTENCDDDKVWEVGDFAYNESLELYPNIPSVWGDLCGKPIRHFRFPDSVITHIHDGKDAVTTYDKNNVVTPIGIRIDHESVKEALDWAVENNIITADDRLRIKSYRVVRGNRFGNKSIRAKGLFYDVWNYDKYNKTYYYPNYAYNDLRPDIFLAPTDATYQGANDSSPTPTTFTATGRYTFHSPDVHFTNTNLGSEIKIEVEEYGKSEGFFNLCDEQPKYKILSTAARTLCFGAGIAAAMSTITKQCRTIEKQRQFISALGVAAGTANWVSLDPTTTSYNSLFPIPGNAIGNAGVTYQDCKGTPFHWLNPVTTAELAGDNPVESGIMFAVQVLTGGISAALYFLTVMLREIDIFTKLVQSLTPEKNYFIQYNSIGKYNGYKVVDNDTGNKTRALEVSKYLEPTIQYIEEGTTNIIFNNLSRETSVYLKVDGDLLPSPETEDNSKKTMDDFGLEYTQLNSIVNADICSYYGSIKDFVPSQYGSIYNISYLETGGSSIDLDLEDIDSKTFFGGDTFINRFALKRKHPFFIQTRFRQLNGSDVSYSELGNAAYPNYYLDFGEGIMEKLSTFDIGDILSDPGAFFQDLVGTDDSRLDARQNKFFYQKGFVHLYNYGIPYFLVESDINVDFRHGENITDKDFYPRQKDLDFWLQEKNVPIERDNTYIYNTTYSKQNRESVLSTIQPNTKFGDVDTILNGQLIYTDRTNTLTETDNWRIIRNDSWHKIPSQLGSIISVDGIEREKVIIRAENGSQLFNAYDVIATENGQSQISTGRIFDSRPQDFALTDLGYIGSQHREILNTEYGHIVIDAKRGNIFNIATGGQSIEELGKNGMKNWFMNNLPFFIKKDFPELTINELDNNYKGIGITMSFDRRYKRLFITKLDYKSINQALRYSTNLKEFYIQTGNTTTIIKLGDPLYFADKSWTISYNFETKSWVSFHSFIPNYYVDFINYFQSGINRDTQSSLWTHSISNKSYQVYYGNLYPYIVDCPSEPSFVSNNLSYIEYLNDSIRFQNEYDSFYNPKVTFNKAVIYNNYQNTGLLNLHLKKVNTLENIYPKQAAEGIDIEVSNTEDSWKINTFFDIANSKNNNLPLWLFDSNNVNKELNKEALNYYKKDLNHPLIKGKICNVRLINDQWSNYKFITTLFKFNQTQSFK